MPLAPTRRGVDVTWTRRGPAPCGRTSALEGLGEMHAVGCARLIGIGVDVADRRRAGRWEFIDLLGIIDRHNRLPVVIEMKGTRSALSPLGALVYAIANGLALKKAWPHRLRADWARAVKEAGFGEPRLPVFLGQTHGDRRRARQPTGAHARWGSI